MKLDPYLTPYTKIYFKKIKDQILRPKTIAQLVKNPPAMQETSVGFLGWEDPLEKG